MKELDMTDDMRSTVLRLIDARGRLPAPSGAPFAELLRHGTLSVEIFSPRIVDTQKPHDRDELYVVVRGSGDFVHGSRRTAVATGDFLFVPAGVVHRFENFTSDLTLWVAFYGPPGGERL
jgi:mannose-6-phosphate isomerase-like protein (cupin superfamily)